MAERRSLEWFNVEMIDDQFLPDVVLEVLGGVHKRRRSSFMELVHVNGRNKGKKQQSSSNIEELLDAAADAHLSLQRKKAWRTLAEDIYETKSNNFKSNFIHTQRYFEENANLLKPLMERCPSFRIILSFILEDRFGFRVEGVDWTSQMQDWTKEDCRRIG